MVLTGHSQHDVGTSLTEDISVLLVEDNDGDAYLVKQALQERSQIHFSVTRAVSLRRGIDLAKSSSLDVVLLDLSLPDSEGLETLELFRATCPEVAVVIFTQFDDEEMALMAFRLGAQEYVPKDQLTGAMLSRVIRYAMERRRMDLELHRLREAADTANRAKSDFLANMSHDIRTPMTAILGFAEILLGEDDVETAPAERVDAYRTIHLNGQYLLELLNDLLDLSKIEVGKFDVRRAEVWPSCLLGDVVSLMSVRAKAKGLPLEAEFEGPVPERILSDPIRLRQILVNLIGNAIKFTESGKIRVVARLVDGCSSVPQLEFDVIDTGMGIMAEQLNVVFEPFTQADPSATRRHSGTGLGLAISKRLANMLGGDITVTSTPEQGSTFRLRVATGRLDGVELISSPSIASTQTDETEPSQTAGHKLACRILLVEDGPDNQRLVSFFLRKSGADVTVAENGKIAVDWVLGAMPEYARRHADKSQPFDIILMDMQMPVLDGYSATRHLRKFGYTAPIIALTAHAMTGDRQKCLEAGCDDFISKPINRDELLSKIAGWCQRRDPAQPATNSCPSEALQEQADS